MKELNLILEFCKQQMDVADKACEIYAEKELFQLASNMGGQSVAYWNIIQFIEINFIESKKV